jgi:HK97 gp10 family phage protein
LSNSGSVTLKVEGLKELESALVGLDEAAPKIIADGLREPMKDVLAEAKALVPRRTGELYDALDLTPTRRATSRRASMADTLSEVGLRIKKPASGKKGPKVGTGGASGGLGNPRYYWHLVEFGTAHSAAQPYIRPAFDRNTERMLGSFKSIVSEGIERTRAKFARGRGGKR